jgi:hypothetical protein
MSENEEKLVFRTLQAVQILCHPDKSSQKLQILWFF